MSAGLSRGLRWRLSILWVLEWGITGAILTYMPIYFTRYGLTSPQLGQLMAVSAVGLWIAPFVVGQVCDRWMSSERYMVIAHAAGGIALVSIPPATEYFSQHGSGFGMLLLLVGLFAAAYFPTIALCSSLTFRHLPNRDEDFGKIRIWGTVGWVVAGLVLSFWLGRHEARLTLDDVLPDVMMFVDNVVAPFPDFRDPLSKDCFYLAAILSFALSAFSFFLPPTPPVVTDKATIAPLETLRMFKNRTFTLLISISFFLALIIPLYSLAVPTFVEQMLKGSKLGSHWVPAVMTVGQISEFPALLLLPLCLKRFGMKATFALGMLAWVVRYALFAFEKPVWLILFGISLHGVCHVFLVIVIQLYVDAACRKDLRASAQNLFAFVTMGIAMPVGFVLSGLWGEYCGIKQTETANYLLFFMVPAGLILVLLIVFAKWFRWPKPVSEDNDLEPPAPKPIADVRG